MQSMRQKKGKMSNGQHMLFSYFQDQVDNEWWDIENVFAAVIAIVEVAQARALQPLKDRRQVVEKEAKSLIEELEAEISVLEKTISELDNISALEDHILFLQVKVNVWLTVSTQLYSQFHIPQSLWVV